MIDMREVAEMADKGFENYVLWVAKKSNDPTFEGKGSFTEFVEETMEDQGVKPEAPSQELCEYMLLTAAYKVIDLIRGV